MNIKQPCIISASLQPANYPICGKCKAQLSGSEYLFTFTNVEGKTPFKSEYVYCVPCGDKEKERLGI